MKDIKNILKVIESPFVDNELLLDEYLIEQKSLVSKLAFNISSGKYANDTEAGRDIYGKAFNKHKFEELKSKTRQRALTTLLTVELKTEYQNSREALHLKLMKMLTQSNILLAFGARPTGVKLLHKIEQNAKKYSFTDVELLATQALRLHYWFAGNKVAYNDATRRLQQLLKLIENEQLGEHLYFTTTQSLVNSTATKTHLSALFKSSLKKYSKIRKSTDSYSLKLNWYHLKVSQLENDSRYKEVITTCVDVLHYIQSKPHFYSHNHYIHFLLAQSGALLQLQDYKALLNLTGTLREAIPLRNPNRQIVERHACLASLRSLNLSSAQTIVANAETILQFNIHEHIKEEWLLLRGYVEFLASLQTNNQSKQNPVLMKSKNSKDKLGINLSALILHALQCVVHRDDKLLNSVDKKMDNYLYRYLHSVKGYDRSIAFLKLLRLIIKEDYDREMIAKNATQYVTFLDKTAQRSEPIEIISYEKLWIILMEYINQ